jgi:hypothetical protein
MSETEETRPGYAIHRHPAVKWLLMVAMLSVAGLSLPHAVSAAAPSVQPPTGPQSGGVFSGAYTFVYYMNCSNGSSYNSTYSSNLDGTNNFRFYGATDGSLLVSIDGGGEQLLSSCGDPYTGSTQVASYTVTKNVAPQPSPTPTPAATPAPTPSSTPLPVGGSSAGNSGGSNSIPGTHAPSNNPGQGKTSLATPTTASTPSVANITPNPITSQADSTPIAVPNSHPKLVSLPNPSRANLNVIKKQSIVADFVERYKWLIVSLLAGILLTTLALIIEWSEMKLLYDRIHLKFGWRLEPLIFRLTSLFHHHAKFEARRQGMSHNRYSGRLMAHHHTSYSALAFLLMVGTVAVGSVSLTSHAADSTLSLVVNGPAPTMGATIINPIEGSVTQSSILSAEGTCGDGLRVEITRNGQFAGSTICTSNGSFVVSLSLIDGINTLAALNFDGASQHGPVTPTVTITYNSPPAVATIPTSSGASTPTVPQQSAPLGLSKPSSTPGGGPALPFYVSSQDHYYSGFPVGQNIEWPVTITGGTPPYQSDVEWGDQSSTTLRVITPGLVTTSHTYIAPGVFHISFSVVDNFGRRAILSLIAVVSGGTIRPVTTTTSSGNNSGGLSIAWPILIGSSLVLVSFWLGERDRLHHGQLAPAQISI